MDDIISYVFPWASSTDWCLLQVFTLTHQVASKYNHIKHSTQQAQRWTLEGSFLIRMYLVLPESNLLESDALCYFDLEMFGEEKMMIFSQFKSCVKSENSV